MPVRTRIALLPALLIVFLAGCAGTAGPVNDGGGKVYALSAEMADRLLLDAMLTEIPRADITPGSGDFPAYTGHVQWDADRDTITAIARPAIGRLRQGGQVMGFVFEVQHSGTAPASGVPMARRILAKVEADATLTGSGAAFVRFQ